jgi:serine/threonine protein kinase
MCPRLEPSVDTLVSRQAEIIRLKQVDHIMSEKSILQAINHPMIISLYGTSQDDLHLYMYMEFVSGGELFSHLRRAGRFTNDTGKFFAASIVLALQHLHGAPARSLLYCRVLWSSLARYEPPRAERTMMSLRSAGHRVP